MITPKLEELIWSGDAEYRTWTVGTPNPVLRIADDETVIFTDIWYDPFIDSRVAVLTPPLSWFGRMNKMFTLSDDKKRYNFLARNFFVENQGVYPDFRHFDIYCPFTGNNVSLSFVNIPTTDTPWVITPGTAPVETKAKPRPLGYGNGAGGLQGINRIVLAAGVSEIRPHYPTPATPGIDSFDDFQAPYIPANVLNAPLTVSNNLGQMQFPMVTLAYVKINKKLTGKLK